MNLKTLHTPEKAVSAIAAFRSEHAKAVSLRILQGHTLSDHTTPVPAFLVCMEGHARYAEAAGRVVDLYPGEAVEIPATVVHRVEAITESLLLLVR